MDPKNLFLLETPEVVQVIGVSNNEYFQKKFRSCERAFP